MYHALLSHNCYSFVFLGMASKAAVEWRRVYDRPICVMSCHSVLPVLKVTEAPPISSIFFARLQDSIEISTHVCDIL